MRGLHPDSPAEVLRAFARAGHRLPNTRAWVLRQVDHPAVPLLLEYKELYRIWTAHGWAWRDAWVSDGRFRPEYVPGGVVSGRWATRGGGALQIPKVVRRAVVADPGWRFVVADAGQLEPRVLAAVSGDARLAAAGARRRPLRGAGRRRVRRRPGQGQGRPARRDVRPDRRRGRSRRWPCCGAATRRPSSTSRRPPAPARPGGLVRSWLGRTCPPASTAWRDAGLEPPRRSGSAEAPQGGATGRARGRFTRNFVIQATAAEWALVLLATLRDGAAPAAGPSWSSSSTTRWSCTARRSRPRQVVDGGARRRGRGAAGCCSATTPVRFPLDVSIVECYADAA